MKKSYIFWFAVFFIICMPAANVQAKVKAPKKECHAYVVMDAGSGQVLFGQDENKQIYPASTAKLMTAIVCIENGDVNSKIKTKADIVNHTTPGTYALGLASGVSFTFQDLLHLSLLSSASDATDTLAVGVFGSKKACADAMNQKCKELGLTQTSFDNPVGSDIGAGFHHTYSTATEMAKITRYAMAIPLIRSVVAKSSYYTRSGQDINVNTTNWFTRGMIEYDRSTYKIIGSKSGTTNAAGHVFIATAMDKLGHEVICAYFGNVSKESTFASIRSLFNYTFKQAKKGKIVLSCSDYDVRNSKSFGPVHDRYASLHCYPQNRSGRFEFRSAVTRTQLARMMRGIDGLKGDTTLASFVLANRAGHVTALRLAELVQDLAPDYLPGKEVKEILKDCPGTQDLNKEEKNAFASFIKHGLVPQDSCRNPKQIITRKQALLFADLFSDYQVRYSIEHPDAPAEYLNEAGELGISSIAFNSKWTQLLNNQKTDQ